MTHILTKEQFQKFQTRFKELAKQRYLSASDMLLYALVKGKSWDHCFTPIKNETRLRCQCNGDPLSTIYSIWFSVQRSTRSMLKGSVNYGAFASFPGIFDDEALKALAVVLEQTPKLEEKNNG